MSAIAYSINFLIMYTGFIKTLSFDYKYKEIMMKLINSSMLAILLFSGQAMAADSNAKTAVGGGLGAAAGTALGGIVGGSTGEILGGELAVG